MDLITTRTGPSGLEQRSYDRTLRSLSSFCKQTCHKNLCGNSGGELRIDIKIPAVSLHRVAGKWESLFSIIIVGFVLILKELDQISS